MTSATATTTLLHEHLDAVTHLALSPSDEVLAVGSRQDPLVFIGPDQRRMNAFVEPNRVKIRTEAELKGIEFAGRDDLVVAITGVDIIGINVSNGHVAWVHQAHRDFGFLRNDPRVVLQIEGHLTYVAMTSGEMMWFDEKGRMVYHVRDNEAPTAACYLPAHEAIFGLQGTHAKMWNARTGAALGPASAMGRIYSVAACPESSLVAFRSEAGLVLADPTDLGVKVVIPCAPGHPMITFLSSENLLVTGAADGLSVFQVYDDSPGDPHAEMLGTWQPPRSRVICVAPYHQEPALAVGLADGSVFKVTAAGLRETHSVITEPDKMEP